MTNPTTQASGQTGLDVEEIFVKDEGGAKCVCEFPDSFYDACFAEFELLRGHDYDAHVARRKSVACACHAHEPKQIKHDTEFLDIPPFLRKYND